MRRRIGWTPRTILVLALAAPIGIAVVGCVGYGDWIPVSHSGEIDTVDPYPCEPYFCPRPPVQGAPLPAKVNVTLRWADTGTDNVNFWVTPPYGVAPPGCSWVESRGGSCVIDSLFGGTYEFHAQNGPGTTDDQVVRYSATYWSALL